MNSNHFEAINMRAVKFDEFGKESAMKIVELPKPSPAPGEVMVKVMAAGVNPVDVLITAGLYFQKPTLPYLPGFEGAGFVYECGENVTRFKPNDRVCFRQGSVGFGRVSGSFSEFVVCAEDDLMLTPDKFVDEESGSFWLAGLTAWGGLCHLLNIQSGQTIVITAASGGVGHIAVQLAKALGAKVIATTRSDEKAVKIRELGADHVINVKNEDLCQVVASLGGADHAFDAVGGETTAQLMKVLKPFGRVVVYGAVSRKPPEVDFPSLITKATGIIGFTMMTLRNTPTLLERAESELLQFVNAGKVRPVIGKVFSLDKSPEAWRAIKDGSYFGKIVICPSLYLGSDAAPPELPPQLD